MSFTCRVWASNSLNRNICSWKSVQNYLIYVESKLLWYEVCYIFWHRVKWELELAVCNRWRTMHVFLASCWCTQLGRLRDCLRRSKTRSAHTVVISFHLFVPVILQSSQCYCICFSCVNVVYCWVQWLKFLVHEGKCILTWKIFLLSMTDSYFTWHQKTLMQSILTNIFHQKEVVDTTQCTQNSDAIFYPLSLQVICHC